jgi:elongation factor Ts
MTKISAKDVAKLRKMTGAGMMDCKKALIETNGNFEEAIDTLRKKGQKVAGKRADRDATEGAVLAKTSNDSKRAAMVVLNCETDFVAKNEDFVKFTQQILDVAVEKNPSNLEELKQLEVNGAKISDEVINQTGVIGEKIELSHYDKIEAEHTAVYIHPGNKLVSIAGFNKSGFEIQAAKDVVMQIAAMSPVAVDKSDVSQQIIDKEIEIGKEQAIQEGKPEELAEKISIGKLNKFFKDSTLLNQQFIKNNKQTVRDYLKVTDKDLIVTGFKRYSLD